MLYVRVLFEDSELLRCHPSVEDVGLKNVTDDELIEILESFNLNNVLFEKMYFSDYNLTDQEFYVLVNQLNYIGNKYLRDILTFIKYKGIKFDNLIADIEKIYNEIFVTECFSLLQKFIICNNIYIVKYIYNNFVCILSDDDLEIICQYGDLNIINYFISLNYNLTSDICLCSAATNNNQEILFYLLNFVDYNNLKIKGKVFSRVIWKHHFELSKYLICKDKSFLDYAIKLAMSENFTEFILYLLEIGGDVTLLSTSILGPILEKNDTKSLEILINYKFNIKLYDGKHLFEVVKNDNYHLMNFLFENCPNIQHSYKIMAYTQAVISGNLNMMKFLLNHGINIEYSCKEDLKISCELNHPEICEFLLNNCSFSQLTKNKELTVATKKQHTNIINLLLKYGANQCPIINS